MARHAALGAADARFEGRGRVLERLALEQPREEQVALLETQELVVELDVVEAGQEPTRLELDEGRGDEEELGRDVEVEGVGAVHRCVELGEVARRRSRERHLPQLHLVAQDEVQQQVERPLVDGRVDVVRHRDTTLPAAIPAPRHPRDDPAEHQPGPVESATSSVTARDRACFSGIQPTGEVHLGNYLGAVRHWVAALDDADSPDQALYCVVDLHAMTAPVRRRRPSPGPPRATYAPHRRRARPDRCTLFVQSHVPARTRAHVAPELRRDVRRAAAHDPVQGQSGPRRGEQESVSVGLFDYPVLMAADILLYDTDRVPVGDDQRQHLELARDLAIRFNHRFGDTFVVPEGDDPARGRTHHGPAGARRRRCRSRPTRPRAPRRSSTRPTRIAKTHQVGGHRLRRRRCASTPPRSPGCRTCCRSSRPRATARSRTSTPSTSGRGYGALKAAVADAVVDSCAPLQARYGELAADPAEVDRILAAGAASAEEISAPSSATSATPSVSFPVPP